MKILGGGVGGGGQVGDGSGWEGFSVAVNKELKL